ncbi:hypothetical protein ACFC0I_29115, partial [Streptomyces sp. NPDC056227]
MPGIQPPAEGDLTPEPVSGCHIPPERYAWFGQVLVGTTAAGLMTFTGSGKATARHLTDRQGQKHFTGYEHAASTSVQDISHELLGKDCSGTDHVFRLDGPRMEAFSGVDSKLFGLLAEGHVEEYRAIVHATRHDRPRVAQEDEEHTAVGGAGGRGGPPPPGGRAAGAVTRGGGSGRGRRTPAEK